HLQNPQLFDRLIKNSFTELVAALTHRETRELALAILVAKHDFDIERALSTSFHSYPILLSNGEKLDVWIGLGEEEYEAIVSFAYQEKYPFHAKGIFHRLKHQKKEGRDKGLEEAFFVTPEFYAFQMLFQKSGMMIDKKILLDLICEGSWEQLTFPVLSQENVLKFSTEQRQALLLSYFSCGSETAAQLLQLEKEVAAPSIGITQTPGLKNASSSVKNREHVVKEGENLWKISRQYQVQIEELRKLNEMEGERLYPGMTLLIPAQ
ncbi:MAG: LysM peptidoglycan-binding domain-containing protein, partial [Chlamydiia bacterium]|nr:LysM peptidoglycan-binding domain-containing protein [Chlamydiia bacterium]